MQRLSGSEAHHIARMLTAPARGSGMAVSLLVTCCLLLLSAAQGGMALAACGDGILDPDEQCDDGNTVPGDCCSATCQFEASGSPCEADGNLCTTDQCDGAGVCVFVGNVTCPDDGTVCNGPEHCDPSAGCVSGPALNCDDGDPCNGTETCDPTLGCQPGTPPPVVCGDGIVCGTEQCDDGNLIDGDCCSSACQFEASGSPCEADGNLCTTDQCDGAGVCVFVGNVTCPDDGTVCNGPEHCDPSAGCVSGPPLTCDDGDPCNGTETCDVTLGCQPGTPPPIVCGDGIKCGSEQCDDGNTADGDCCSATCQAEDLGSVGCGAGACARTVPRCVNGVPQTCVPGTPVPETCNGLDDDCDGQIDQGLGSTTCAVGACARTVQNCVNGVPQTCTPGAPGVETCNGIDDDCDGQIDQGLGSTTCGVGACMRTVDNCANGVLQTCAPGTPGIEGPAGSPSCTNGIDDDCDGATDANDTGCQLVCGNGFIDPGEQCDDGNTIDGDGCDSNCTLPGCGNGILDPGEECDDGNVNNCDGCSSLCRIEPAGASWCFAGGPEGGIVFDLAVDPQNPSTLYAATNSTLFKSTDGGQDWLPMSSGIRQLVRKVAVSPGDSSIVLAGTAQFFVGLSTGIYRSTDAGASWSFRQDDTEVLTIVFDPAEPSVVYAGGVQQGVLKSIDAGLTWTRVGGGTEPAGWGWTRAIAIDPSNPATLYAGSEGGVRKSTDAGRNWTQKNEGLPQDPCGAACALAVDPRSPSVVNFSSNGTLYRSSDGGAHWSQVLVDSVDCRFPARLLFDPLDSSVLYGLGDRLCRSTDGGGSWVNVGPDLSSVAFDPMSPGTLYGGGMGVFKTTDGGNSWLPINRGLHAANIRALKTDPTNADRVYAASEIGVWLGQGGGSAWSARNSGLPFFSVFGDYNIRSLDIDATQPNIIYAGLFQQGVFKSTDGALSWNACNDGLPAGALYDLAVAPPNPSTVYVSVGAVYKSEDACVHWSKVLDDSRIVALAADPSTPGTVYASLAGGGPDAYYKTTDGGANWTLYEHPTGIGYPYMYIRLIDPTNPAVVYAMTDYGVAKSTDGGLTWVVTGGPRAVAIVMDPSNTSVIYAASPNIGLYVSTDAGGTWQLDSAVGLTNQALFALAVGEVGSALSPSRSLANFFDEAQMTRSAWAALPEMIFGIRAPAADAPRQALLYGGTQNTGGVSGVFRKVIGAVTAAPTQTTATFTPTNTPTATPTPTNTPVFNTPGVCGNGIVDPGEQCDDGNLVSGDCCSATCQAENLGSTTCGVGACARTVPRCVNGVPQACVPGTPAPEICNGIDDDCDGQIDQGLGSTTCGVGACARTVQNCVNGVPQTCTPGAPGVETCNGIDDDCDGQIDQGLGSTTCGVGACMRTVDNCANGVLQTCAPGTPGIEGPAGSPSCTNGIDDDCDGLTDASDPGCQNVCGNGVLDPGEQCDDGNTISGDGCSATCQSELIPGGGLIATDCKQEWQAALVPARDRKGMPMNRQACTDGDSTCDFNAAGDNACTFHVKLCFNVTERRFQCAPIDVASVQLSAPRTAIDRANRDALETALKGLGGSVRGQCTNRGPKRGQACGANGDCDSALNSGDGVCGRRLVTFQPPLSAGDRCTDFASITVPLRQIGTTFRASTKTLSLTASPSNDPVTGRRRPKDMDSLTLVCKPRP
jgi:cysteine-rich repeat protein